MERITAGVACEEPPRWALLERHLLDLYGEAIDPVLETYVSDGEMLWPEDGGGLDDTYESFFSWPLAYLLGADERLLEVSKRRWERITERFSEDGPGYAWQEAVEEFSAAQDWMHQGEGKQFFYYICLADPDDEEFAERARRFASYYTDPAAGNYDPETRILTAPKTGSEGPKQPDNEEWGYASWKEHYGLPFQDVEGVDEVADLKDPEKARRMAEAVNERWRGEVAGNLAATSLVTNAYLMTGADACREWVEEYVEAWVERTRENDGMVPDNVGLSGEVGEYLDGKWYGGRYGWTWPHGWPPLGDAIFAAAENAVLVSEGDTSALEMARSTLDTLAENGIEADGTLHVPFKHGEEGSLDYTPLRDEYVLKDEDGAVLYRDGWFEFQPMFGAQPAHLWLASMAESDADRIDALWDGRRTGSDGIVDEDRGVDGKDMGGNEWGWIAYLRGESPGYPERILDHCHETASRRLDMIRQDPPDFHPEGDEYLHERNPLDVEGLVQLTMGGPLPLYNGGLLRTQLRHFDPDRRRPGLPPDVGALVSGITAERTTVELVNLGATERSVVVQAGTCAEHRFGRGTYTVESGGGVETRSVDVGGSAVEVALPGCTRTRLELETDRFAGTPTYAAPWARG